MLGVGPQIHMPPGDDALEKQRSSRRAGQIDAANASRRARGKKTPWKPPTAIPRPTMIAIQVAGTVFVVLVFTAVWYGVTFTQQGSKEPPEPLPQSLVAFVPGWFGFCFWVGPRLFSMYRSFKDKKKEGITTASIVVGALTHGFNTAVRPALPSSRPSRPS